MTEAINSHQGFVVGDGNHPGTCKDCGVYFEGLRPFMTQCFQCNYKELEREAEERFAALKLYVEAAGWRAEVVQTGGMVMCLVGLPTDGPLPYCMWGDPDEWSPYEFSVYVQDEDTEQDLMVELSARNLSDLKRCLKEFWPPILEAALDPRRDSIRVVRNRWRPFRISPLPGRYSR